jgi:hypothetical protein
MPKMEVQRFLTNHNTPGYHEHSSADLSLPKHYTDAVLAAEQDP